MNTPASTPIEFNDKKDRNLIDIRSCTALSCVVYCALAGYMTLPVKILWIAGAFLVSVLLWYAGRAAQKLLFRLFGRSKPVYDRDKQLKEYFRFTDILMAFVIGIPVCAAFFGIACAVRQIYYSVTVHETIAHAKGIVYEISAALCGFATVFISALSWQVPEERQYSHDTTVISYVVPLAMALIPTILFGMPTYVAVVYVGVYLILTYVRFSLIKSHNRKVKQQSNYEEDRRDRRRWGE